jgi:hypothetical protein
MPFPRVIPHSDGAGMVKSVGEGVDPARVGRRVWVHGAQWRLCACAPRGRGTRESEELGKVGRRMSSTTIEGLAFHFTVFGMDSAEARRRAEAVVSAVEGTLITAHALRSLSPFESMLAVLVDKANMLTVGAPKSVPASH